MSIEGVDTGVPVTRRIGLVTYTTFCVCVVAVVFLTNWPSYQYAVRGGMIPLYYYMLPAVFMVPVLFAEPGAALRLTRDPLQWWFVIFVATGLLWLLLAQDIVEDSTRQWRLRALSFIMFAAIGLLASQAHARIVGWVILGCVVLASAFNWFDVLRPFRFVPQGIEGASEGRGAGLFINPNAAASFVVMGTIAALPMIPVRLRGLLLVTAVFGVAATFSRGAFVMVAATLAGAVFLKLVKRGQGILLIVALPVLVTGVSLSYDYLIGASESRNIKAVVERLNWFSSLDEEDQAVEGRRYGARNAWQIFLDNPVAGKGPGAASLEIQQEGPHNMYLLLMAEQGLVGLLLYVTLIGTFLRRGRRIARAARSSPERDVGNALVLMGVFLALYGFFSHNVLEEPHTIFLLAFAAALALNANSIRGARGGLASASAPRSTRRVGSAA